MADKLQRLSASPVLAELLALSGLTLAQAGKPQTIDLSAAAAGLDRGGTLAAASALGSEAAALGHSWGSGGSRDSSSSNSAANAKRDGGSVAAPAVIGIAVAVAVSVVAVCIAAVAIVVVKQRAKQARAAAAVDEQQLPKSSKVGDWSLFGCRTSCVTGLARQQAHVCYRPPLLGTHFGLSKRSLFTAGSRR